MLYIVRASTTTMNDLIIIIALILLNGVFTKVLAMFLVPL